MNLPRMVFLRNKKSYGSLEKFFQVLEKFYPRYDLVIVVSSICADYDMIDENFSDAADMAVKNDWQMEKTNIQRIELTKIKGLEQK